MHTRSRFGFTTSRVSTHVLLVHLGPTNFARSCTLVANDLRPLIIAGSLMQERRPRANEVFLVCRVSCMSRVGPSTHLHPSLFMMFLPLDSASFVTTSGRLFGGLEDRVASRSRPVVVDRKMARVPPLLASYDPPLRRWSCVGPNVDEEPGGRRDKTKALTVETNCNECTSQHLVPRPEFAEHRPISIAACKRAIRKTCGP